MEELALLILGAGWTSNFLIPLLQSRNIAFAATTTSGHPVAGVPTIPFKFDASAPSPETRSAIAALPRARYILVTFPLTGTGPSKLLVETYSQTHLTTAASPTKTTTDPFRFIQFGSTGIWQQPSAAATAAPSIAPRQTTDNPWITRHTPPTVPLSPRCYAEEELLAVGGCVLNLAGLWGGSRAPRNWAARVAPTKEAVRGKASLHLIHGEDVARLVVAVVMGGEEVWELKGRGQRWMVTDGFVYDWWALLAGWVDGEAGAERAKWVWELMGEVGVRALPRAMEVLGRCYDSRELWQVWGLVPVKGRVK